MNPPLTYLNKLYSYIHRTLHSLETYVMRVMLVSWVVVLCKYTGLPTKDETFSTTQNSLKFWRLHFKRLIKSWNWIGMSSFVQSSLIFHLLWVTLCKKVAQLKEEYGGRACFRFIFHCKIEERNFFAEIQIFRTQNLKIYK